MHKRSLSIFVLLLILQLQLIEMANAGNESNLGRVMWSAFSCAAYAEMAGNRSEQQRLFSVGYKAGRNFVDGVRKKTIDKAEIKNAPIVVLMYMEGPSTDFIVGRIYEAATNDAFDKVVKEDESGFLITDPSKLTEDERKVIRAKNQFQRSNCILIH